MKKILVGLMVCSFLISFLNAQEKPEMAGINWTTPDSIDPFSKGVGDFLDIDITEYLAQAFSYYEDGDCENAARYYLAYLRFDANNATAIYNLACCYGLLGKADLAAKYLKRAANAGFDNVEHMQKDPDFDKVKTEAIFIQAMDSITIAIEKEQKRMGETIYMEGSSYYKCKIYKPGNFQAGNKYTLILGLHGWGSNPDLFVGLWEKFNKPDFIYACPQAPYAFSVREELGYSWEEWSPDNEDFNTKTKTLSEKYIMDWLKKLKEDYNIGEVYLMGFSQGAYLSYSVGIKNHLSFDGIMPFGGWLDLDWIPEDDLKNAKTLRVFIAHGKNDASVEFEAAEKATEALRKLGYEVTFVDFEGGHTMPEHVIKKAEIWMRGE